MPYTHKQRSLARELQTTLLQCTLHDYIITHTHTKKMFLILPSSCGCPHMLKTVKLFRTQRSPKFICRYKTHRGHMILSGTHEPRTKCLGEHLVWWTPGPLTHHLGSAVLWTDGPRMKCHWLVGPSTSSPRRSVVL